MKPWGMRLIKELQLVETSPKTARNCSGQERCASLLPGTASHCSNAALSSGGGAIYRLDQASGCLSAIHEEFFHEKYSCSDYSNDRSYVFCEAGAVCRAWAGLEMQLLLNWVE